MIGATISSDRPARIRSRAMLLVLMCVVELIIVVSVTLMTVSLPHIQGDLKLADHDLQWIVTGYGLTFGGLLLVGGRVADCFGRRLALLLGLSVFIVGGVMCFLAPVAVVLIAGRVVQGLGGSLALPAAMSLMTAAFTEARQRSLALGAWAAIGAAGAVLGNVGGGFMSALASWRWSFVPVVGLAAIVLALCPVFLRPNVRDRSRPLALGSGALVTLAIGLCIFGLSQASVNGIGSWVCWGPLVVAALAVLGFVLIERRSSSPLIPIAAFRRRDALGFAFVALASGVTTGTYYFSSLFMQNVRGFTGEQAGLAFGLWAAMIIAGSQIASRLLGRRTARSLLLFAFPLTTVGSVLFGATLSTSEGFFPWIAMAFVAIGIGGGMASVSGTVTALSTLPAEQQGLASGVLNASQQIASVLTLAVLVSIQVSDANALRSHHTAALLAQVDGMQLAVLCSVLFGVVAIVLAAVGLRGGQPADSSRMTTEARLTEGEIGDSML